MRYISETNVRLFFDQIDFEMQVYTRIIDTLYENKYIN